MVSAPPPPDGGGTVVPGGGGGHFLGFLGMKFFWGGGGGRSGSGVSILQQLETDSHVHSRHSTGFSHVSPLLSLVCIAPSSS